MSLPLDLLFNQVAKAIGNHSSPNTPGPSYDANPLLGGLQGLFGQFAQSNGHQFQPNQQYGDGQEFDNQYGNAADNQQGQLASSDSDPFGDPGLQGGQGGQGRQGGQSAQNPLSSDQDPFGDPGAQR